MIRKISIPILVIITLFLTTSTTLAATRMYGRDCTGATGDTCTNQMSAITGMSAGDWCTVPNETDRTISWYMYATSGVTESYPEAIDDDNDGGTAGWNLFRGTPQGNIQFSISDPENLPTHGIRGTSSMLVWYNDTGLTLTITTLRAQCDEQNYTFDLFYSASNTDISTTNDVRVDTASFVCNLGNATNGYYDLQTSGFEQPSIPTSRYLIFEHTSGTGGTVHVYIEGYLN